jgi:hypothetical protein
MPNRYLPTFEFDLSVSAATARQDKIEISVGVGSISGDSFSETAGEIGNFDPAPII